MHKQFCLVSKKIFHDHKHWNWARFKAIRNYHVNVIRKARNDYFKRLSADINYRKRSLKRWKLIGRLTKSQSKPWIPTIIDNEHLYENNTVKAILLDTSKACGPDLISPLLLKEDAILYVSSLTNRSVLLVFQTHDKWPTSFLSIKKHQLLNQLCRISLLSITGNIYEWCVYNFLYEYFQKYINYHF